jgi:uncharacterized protein YjiS (DUF1127 family)
MAISSPIAAGAATPFAARIAERVLGRWEAYLLRRMQRASVQMLRGLDDAALKDIGIDRSEIESVVYKGCDRARHFESPRRHNHPQTRTLVHRHEGRGCW